MDEGSAAPEAGPAVLPPGLRALQRLVTVLTVTMIAGIVVLVGAFLWRLNATGPDLPAGVTLPDGAAPLAFTQGGDWFAVVVVQDGTERILVFDRLTGRLRQTVAID
jgi:hypothetical protein